MTDYKRLITNAARCKLTEENFTGEIVRVPKLLTYEQCGNKTTFYWDDLTKTEVCLSQNEDNDLYVAFCAAFAKRMYGNNTRIHNEVDNKAFQDIRNKCIEKEAKLSKQIRDKKLKNIRKKIRRQARKEPYPAYDEQNLKEDLLDILMEIFCR